MKYFYTWYKELEILFVKLPKVFGLLEFIVVDITIGIISLGRILICPVVFNDIIEKLTRQYL
ncbi:hypothetical protein BCR32DRAFT_274428 [Anaeromyces robustus]|uniref:Uncharacterized protein n=1 Tax=Anaeromyces robustus TaxID=1754192 RepID=A0A1Y1XNZ7_9FUNG|nr:hypothetical protein BCR32DRAFT_274428 [Anaeromyces robustus]|eukprot:ORX87451.1 hypothetical protein BCR32DRAFT_274428 [Anaeromyces robustus]